MATKNKILKKMVGAGMINSGGSTFADKALEGMKGLDVPGKLQYLKNLTKVDPVEQARWVKEMNMKSGGASNPSLAAPAAGAGAFGALGIVAPVVAGLTGAYAIARQKGKFDREIDQYTNSNMRNQETIVNAVRAKRGLSPLPLTPRYVPTPSFTDKIDKAYLHPVNTIKKGASALAGATKNFINKRK
jgi:hypothetical protein